MDVLDKITQLRLERHWSEYSLAEKSGLTQSTISSWYRKGIVPSVPSIQKICDAFGISLSQFFLEEDKSVILTENQLLLLRAATKLDNHQFMKLIDFLNSL